MTLGMDSTVAGVEGSKEGEMGAALGVGVTHFPFLAYEDTHMADILQDTLADPGLPQEAGKPEAWAEGMWDDFHDTKRLLAAAREHRQALVDGFVKVRVALDAFAPDVVVMVGDDQYENFREEVVPPFCVLALDDMVVRPWAHNTSANVWGEDKSTTLSFPGARAFAKTLVAEFLIRDIDMAYSYQLRDDTVLPHAFLNTLLYLDWERQGWHYPVVPISINCYGRSLIQRRGGVGSFGESPNLGGGPDPPAPRPERCLALGAALGEILVDRPERVAVVASSSWSHAFLNDKALRLYPDVAADRVLYEALTNQSYGRWRDTELADLERAGQHELLNWFVLVGFADQLGLTLEWSSFVETHLFNSNKCFAVFQPPTGHKSDEASRESFATGEGVHDDRR